MPIFEPIMPSDQREHPRVHWHAHAETRTDHSPSHAGDRAARLDRPPVAVLRSPWQVADWIDQQTRQHGWRRRVWVGDQWGHIGDEVDLEHLRRENFGIASNATTFMWRQ